MSAKAAEAEAGVCCANCGVAEVDIKLKDCDGCDLVKYCCDKCTENHREQHNEECKKRAQELHNDHLFRQPDGTHDGECPLCFLPMPLEPQKCTFYSCCSSSICNGCAFAHHVMNGVGFNCPFCREPLSDAEENEKRDMKRIKAGDPAAIYSMGAKYYGQGDYDGALEHWTKASELGHALAHYQLGCMYRRGLGVEKKDEEKAVYHWEKAAIGGVPEARYNLAVTEEANGNIERAVKHSIIAAKLGDELSMKGLWGFYNDGNITKDDLDATLRTHKAALDEMKSPERDVAEAFHNSRR